MFSWLRDRLEILRLVLRHPGPLLWVGFLQMVFFFAGMIPATIFSPSVLRIPRFIPWYAWAMGWLAAFWLSTLEYSVRRKKSFDETSINFFRAYLDFLIHEGNKLFDHSAEKEFYSRINDWRHQALQGIAIGLGPAASEKFFQKMEAKNPLSEAYRKSTAANANEPLCLSLQEHLEELSVMRMELNDRSLSRALGEAGSDKTDLSIRKPGPRPPARPGRTLPP